MYETGYVARWFYNSKLPGQEALALRAWASYYNDLVPPLEGRGCRERRRVIHTLCNGVCSGCGCGSCYIPPVLARTNMCIYIYIYAFVCTCICLFLCLHVSICKFRCICIWKCIFVSISMFLFLVSICTITPRRRSCAHSTVF